MNRIRASFSPFWSARKLAASVLMASLLGWLPLQVSAGVFSCNSTFSVEIGDGSPIFVGDTVQAQVTIGASNIEGGTYLELDLLKFGPDCGELQGVLPNPPVPGICISPGNDIEFVTGSLSTTCLDALNQPVTFNVTDATLGDILDLEPNNPIRIYDPADVGTGEQSQCQLTAFFKVNSLVGNPPVTRIHEAFGWSSENGTCDNEESRSSNNTFSFFVSQPAIDIEKSTNGEDADDPTGPNILVGDAVQWDFLVTNIGNEILENIAVDDDVIGSITCPETTLAPAESMTCTAFGTAEAGQYANTGHVIGTFVVRDEQNQVVETFDVEDSDPSHYFGVLPEISILKEISVVSSEGPWLPADDVASAAVAVAAADAWYRITVTNTGEVDLINVVINDDTLGLVNVAVPNLAPGQSYVLDSGINRALFVEDRCEGSGEYLNVAVATANPEQLPQYPLRDEDGAYLVCVEPSLAVLKEISVSGPGGPWLDANEEGNTPIAVVPADAWYRITVTNTGDTDMTDILVNDVTLGLVDVPVPDLAPGASYVLDSGVNQALFVEDRCTSSGQYPNLAVAEAEPVLVPGEQFVDEDPANLVCIDPSIELVKEISIDDGTTWFDANDPGSAPQAVAPVDAAYRITVTNTGDTDLENVVVTDNDLAGPWPFTVPGGLAVGESYVLLPDDIPQLFVEGRCTEAGSFLNTASVSADPVPLPSATVSDDDPAYLLCDARLTTFRVTKIFSDANPMPVEVYLYCNTGQPLEQHFTIYHGEENGVTFVVTLFNENALDCRAFEDPLPEGYETYYDLLESESDGFVDSEGCHWENVTPGDRNECQIFNDLQEVTVYAEKIWLSDATYSGKYDEGYPEVRFVLDCSETEHEDRTIVGDGVVSWTFLPSWKEDICSILEVEPVDSSIISEANEYCYYQEIGPGFEYEGNPGDPASPVVDWCVWTNTRFFEGVPTLNQYGLLLLILLSAGVGAIGIRRFI